MVNQTPTDNEGGNDTRSESTLVVLAQYLKDLSFENPHAPHSLQLQNKNSNLSVEINVEAQDLEDQKYEVTLSIHTKAMSEDKTIFAIELVYAGLFHIENIPQEHLPPILFIECPRLLFPFARQILADLTQQGGFSPFLLDPIDFTTLFQKRILENSRNPKRPN